MTRYYNDYLQTDDTLAHYGVLGMKWGVRHDKERANSKRNQMQSELDELRRYEANARKNPKSLGASKLSTAVRNHQIRSLENKISKTSKNNSKSLSKASKPKQKKKSKHYVRNTLLVAGGIGIAALATNEDVKFAVSLGKDVIDAMKSEIKIEKAFYKAHPEALKKLATM